MGFPALTDPVPSNWITLEDDYLTLVAGLSPLLSNKYITSPETVLGRGQLYLLFVNNNVSRIDLLRLMNSMESGQHINHPRVNMLQARACRLEPLSPNGRLVVDGEEVDYGVIQAEVNKHIHVFSRKRRQK